MITPMKDTIDEVAILGKRISEFGRISVEMDEYTRLSGWYYASLTPFWRALYIMHANVMRNFGIKQKHFRLRYLINNTYLGKGEHVDMCGKYFRALKRDEVRDKLPWHLDYGHPFLEVGIGGWANGYNQNSLSPKQLLEENNELTTMAIGMFIANAPTPQMVNMDVISGTNTNKWLYDLQTWWAGDILEEDRKKVMDYVLLFGGLSRVKQVEKHGAISPEDVASYMIAVPAICPDGKTTEERITLAVKNMKDWTEEDFWNEMTELLERSKLEKDSKQIMRIMEMKAKAMGLLKEDNKSSNFTFVMLEEKAKTLISALGIADKRVVIDV